MNSKCFEVYMLDISIGFTLHLIWYFPLSYFSCNCAPNKSPLLLCWGSFLGYHGNTTNFIYIFSVSNWYPIIFMRNIPAPNVCKRMASFLQWDSYMPNDVNHLEALNALGWETLKTNVQSSAWYDTKLSSGYIYI